MESRMMGRKVFVQSWDCVYIGLLQARKNNKVDNTLYRSWPILFEVMSPARA